MLDGVENVPRIQTKKLSRREFIIIIIPAVSLFKITLYADFLNGIFLPIIFFFLYKFSNSESLMGKYKNSKLQNFLLITCAIVITIASLVGGFGKILHG